jgi:hypothetical protein
MCIGSVYHITGATVSRIHILLPQSDKSRYAAQAAREGKSLGAWLREAAEEKLRQAGSGVRLDSLEELDAFFAECDARESAREPDWEEHLRVIGRSRAASLEAT